MEVRRWRLEYEVQRVGRRGVRGGEFGDRGYRGSW